MMVIYSPHLYKRPRQLKQLLKETLFGISLKIEVFIRAILTASSTLPLVDIPDWDAAIDGCRKFRFYCGTCRDGSGPTLWQPQPEGWICV